MLLAQHPREEFHRLNTARIVEHSLERCDRVVAPVERMDQALLAAGLRPDAAVLYPSEDAELLEDLNESLAQVLIIDGTWHHAKTLVRDVPMLRTLRRIRFVREQPSEYRLRKEPRLEYLSTVESVHHVLRHIEPQTPGLDRLLDSFRYMIDRNLAARQIQGRQQRFVCRSRLRDHRFPSLLFSPQSRFVTVYAEGTTRFGASESARMEPLFIGLHRPFHPTASLEIVCRTSCVPRDRLLDQLGLTFSDVEAGTSLDDAARLVSTWLKDDDVVCVWNLSSAALIEQLGVHPTRTIGLKGAYADYVRYLHFARGDRGAEPSDDDPGRGKCRGLAPQRFGALGDVLERHGLEVMVGAGGRGRTRLLQTSAVLRWLRGRASGQ